MTQGEAREKYRGDWLYWHTAKHCWNNQKIMAAHAEAEPSVPLPVPRPLIEKSTSAPSGFPTERWWAPPDSVLLPGRWLNELQEFGHGLPERLR